MFADLGLEADFFVEGHAICWFSRSTPGCGGPGRWAFDETALSVWHASFKLSHAEIFLRDGFDYGGKFSEFIFASVLELVFGRQECKRRV